ncbi:hypothetical protein R5R35_012487 [Gryllus longicercus]|uniref:Uncharacterized protein n=1 Tax=Gryllus longicercus TaxID=2509291 RepID=A0AAN9VH44_9ORTH
MPLRAGVAPSCAGTRTRRAGCGRLPAHGYDSGYGLRKRLGGFLRHFQQREWGFFVMHLAPYVRINKWHFIILRKNLSQKRVAIQNARIEQQFLALVLRSVF